jgi:PAS domain S-box-containing protein
LRAQLCESERRFQQLATMLDLAHDPIFAWTDKDGIEFWNRGSEQLYGYSRNEALGASSHDLLKTVFSVPLEQFEAELRQHGLWSGEVRHTTKDGRQIIVSSQHQMLCVGDRALVLEANRDITDQKKAEELNLQSQKMESLGTLAGGVAHDFNNILLAISGHCGLAAKAIRPGHPAQQNLTEIGNASDRAAQLVRRILLFARQEEPKRGIVKLEDIVSEALSLMRASLPAMIEIRSTYASGLRAISADSTQIHQLLVNVLTNSAHAIGNRPGAIDVTVSRASGLELKAEHPELTENEYICLMISDDGCGIEPAILKRIFDPFFTTKSVGQGTGLGLSAVHGILASHCGAVDVKSKVGVGTALRVYFPAAGSSAPSVSRPKQTHEQGYGEHILYVDDEVVIAQLMTTILQRMNYRVTCFTDPEHALRAFQKDPTAYQAVITDLSMPHMTGFDLARAIRLISTRIPILLTSGCIRAEDEIAAQALGIEEVLLKPDSIERLSSALVRAIRGVKV